MRSSRHHFSWIASTCELDGAGVFIGIAPGLEAAALLAGTGDDQLACHGQHAVTLHHGGRPLQLQLFAVRDPGIVVVEPSDAHASPDGFQTVSLTWNLIRGRPVAGRPRGEAEPAAVVAFLLTIGFPADSEAEFFRHRMPEFLRETWGSLPALLRQTGCTKPEDLVA